MNKDNTIQKRTVTGRPSNIQKQKLVQLIAANRNILDNKASSQTEKSDFWSAATEELNACHGVCKSKDQWKKCWSDLKCVVKRQYMQWKKYNSELSQDNPYKEPMPKPIEGFYMNILPFLSGGDLGDFEEVLEGDEMNPKDHTTDIYEIEEIFIKDEDISNDYFDDEESVYSEEYNVQNNTRFKSLIENDVINTEIEEENLKNPRKKSKIEVIVDTENEPCDDIEILPIEVLDERMSVVKSEPLENSNQIDEVGKILEKYHTDVIENNNRPIVINLSQDTWQKFQKDPAYAKFFEGNGQDVPEVLETAIELGEEGRTLWPNDAVTILLDYVKNNIDKVGKCMEIKNKTKLWQIISGKLLDAGHVLTPVQVESKYKSLFRQFKKVKLNTVTVRNRTNCPYQSELQEIFAKQQGGDVQILCDEEVQCSLNSETLKDATPFTSTSERQLEVLIQMAADRRREHKELMQFLREKEQAKDARSKRKEELLLKLFGKQRNN